MSLEDKVALITGADGPVGAAIALRFAREGATVVLNDIVSKRLERVATDVTEVEGGKVYIALGDVRNRSHVERMVRETVDAYGRIDILVNNAGEDDDTVLQGAVLCSEAAVPAMCERRWGRIITTSFVSNGGVIAFTRRLALEYARDGVTVNCVAPGATMTAMARIPMGRSADPREVAAAHAFLASDDAAYITGQVLHVDGGLSLVD